VEESGGGSSSNRDPPLLFPDGPKPKKTKKKRLLIQGVQEVSPGEDAGGGDLESPAGDSADVAFIIQVTLQKYFILLEAVK